MTTRLVFLSVILAIVLTGRSFGSSLEEVCDAFSGYRLDGDDQVTLDSLRPLVTRGESGPRVLMLVEPRLLESLDGATDLTPLLARWADDLARDGFRAAVIGAQLAPSTVHRDGRYILALREFLRSVRQNGDLAGVVLVGRFPDAYIVRTCNWRRCDDLTLHKKTDAPAKYKKARYVRRVPEAVALRADIVLGDLDGRWEDVYVQTPTRLPSIVAVFGDAIPPHGGPCLDVEQGFVEFQDFFHVSDGKLEIGQQVGPDGQPAGPSVALFDDSGDLECSPADRQRTNSIAHPEILVSRLDARGVALRPRADIVGRDGRKLLDKQGSPQAVQFSSADAVPHWRDAIWEADPVLERRLLADYFDRNHSYRRGGVAAIAWRPSSIACDLGSGYQALARAADDWQEADEALADIHGRATLAQFTEWIQYPAILRTVRAHSDEWGSMFRRSSAAGLDEQIARPWSWTRRGDTLVPSLAAAAGRGKLDWFLLRSLWENGAVTVEPAFYLHGGCHAVSPGGADRLPYDHPDYGLRQGAESLLLYASGLALLGRAKVFYDEPRGFAEVLREGGAFGETWRNYFDAESQVSWDEAGGDIGRKRSYFWSVLGDWTLTLSQGHPRDLSLGVP